MTTCCGPAPSVLGPPSQAGYLAFLRGVVGIPVAALPDNSFSVTLSYALATDICSCWLAIIAQDVYTVALYNLAADRLVQFAPDQPGQTYFATLRKDLNLTQFVAGVIDSSNDQGTGEHMVVPDWAKTLTIMDLASLRTPWGQQYLALAQQIGSLWGLN